MCGTADPAKLNDLFGVRSNYLGDVEPAAEDLFAYDA
jgi:hypothetical protein